MSKLLKIDTDYADWIKDLSQRFRQSQIKAAVKVNSELIQFYWELGRDIVELKAEERWSDNFWGNLHTDLIALLPDVKGLSVTNLQYTKRFYHLYNSLVMRHPQLVGDDTVELQRLFFIPWGHHRFIIDKCFNAPKKALFYVNKVFENNWSRAVLLNFLDTDLYERQGKAVTNFKETLPDVQGDLAQQLMKDPYCFDFVQLTDRYNEKELKDALVHNVEKFLLEMGNGFAYMGREYRIEVGDTELFADMLFYNTHLHCYVVVEVKIGTF